jgi:hypothetical protein
MKTNDNRLRIIFTLGVMLFAVLIIFCFVSLSRNADERSERAVIENMETVLRRGAAACYASEGAYPPNAEYLIERYCVGIDLNRYAVFYEIFSENIMPTITVVEY